MGRQSFPFNYSNSLVKAMNPKSMNPYLVGCKIWQNLVERWDKGLHGEDYERVVKQEDKDNWDTKAMAGHEKMLQVTKTYQDWFFVMDFLTPELVDDLNLYIYVYQETPEAHQLIRTKHTAQQIRDLIVASFANSHIPKIEIETINYEDAGKILLRHRHQGADLQLDYAKKTMAHIHELWGRDCILKTIINKKPMNIVSGRTLKNGVEVFEDKDPEPIEEIPV